MTTRHHCQTSRPAGQPAGARRPGGSATAVRRRKRRGGAWRRRGLTALAPRWGAAFGGGGWSGGSAALHHRLISYVPPARRGGAAGRAGESRTKMSKLQSQAGRLRCPCATVRWLGEVGRTTESRGRARLSAAWHEVSRLPQRRAGDRRAHQIRLLPSAATVRRWISHRLGRPRSVCRVPAKAAGSIRRCWGRPDRRIFSGGLAAEQGFPRRGDGRVRLAWLALARTAGGTHGCARAVAGGLFACVENDLT